VETFKKAGVRVVNMSWRHSPAVYEGALLTVVQAKDLITKGAETNGRVNLINPPRTLEMAGIKLPAGV
jgi:hypothetical protein